MSHGSFRVPLSCRYPWLSGQTYHHSKRCSHPTRFIYKFTLQKLPRGAAKSALACKRKYPYQRLCYLHQWYHWSTLLGWECGRLSAWLRYRRSAFLSKVRFLPFYISVATRYQALVPASRAHAKSARLLWCCRGSWSVACSQFSPIAAYLKSGVHSHRERPVGRQKCQSWCTCCRRDSVFWLRCCQTRSRRISWLFAHTDSRTLRWLRLCRLMAALTRPRSPGPHSFRASVSRCRLETCSAAQRARFSGAWAPLVNSPRQGAVAKLRALLCATHFQLEFRVYSTLINQNSPESRTEPSALGT